MTKGPWICPVCGELTSGELCRRCGQSRPVEGPDGPQPGSWLHTYGYRSMRSFEVLGGFFLVILLGSLTITAPLIPPAATYTLAAVVSLFLLLKLLRRIRLVLALRRARKF